MSYTDAVPDTEPAREWLENAACRAESVDPDQMFPDSNAAGIAIAKRICRPCPVWRDCLLDALHTGDNQWGIRGGLKPEERRAIAKQRATNTTTPLPDPRKPGQPRPATLAELFARRTTRTNDGHVLWHGSEHVQFRGRKYTALQAAFAVGHGRDPEGIIRRTCGTNCYRSDHLTDAVIRDELAVCGSTAGYHAHRRRGEDPCARCKRARAGKAGGKKVAV